MIAVMERFTEKMRRRRGYYQHNGVHGETKRRIIAYLKKTKKLYNDNWIKNTFYDDMKIITTPEFAPLERRLFNLEKKLTTALYR